MIDGTFLAVAGVGVAAFDVYAYYKYKHAVDVLEERNAAKPAQTETPESELAVEAGNTGVEASGDETLMFESELPMVGEAPAVTLGDYQPTNDMVSELAEKNARLEAEIAALKRPKRAAGKAKAKKAKKRK